MRGADQLPGPPLDEWLVHVLRGTREVVVVGAVAKLAGQVEMLAAARGWKVGEVDGPLAAVIVLQVLGTLEVGGEAARMVEQVVPGGLVIELGHPPALRPWQLWRWWRGRRTLRASAELRAQAWLGHGLYAVEQWAPVDLPQVLVTCGRRRAIPRA